SARISADCKKSFLAKSAGAARHVAYDEPAFPFSCFRRRGRRLALFCYRDKATEGETDSCSGRARAMGNKSVTYSCWQQLQGYARNGRDTREIPACWPNRLQNGVIADRSSRNE